jgi:hypothetical protein
MGILNQITKANDHEVFFVQAPLYQRADGTRINDNVTTRKNGFLRIETWRVTQDQGAFLKAADVSFDVKALEEGLRPGARLSVVLQPEHVKTKKIEAIRSEIFKAFGLDGSTENKHKVRGGYATICLIVKAGKQLVTPQDPRFNAYYQLVVSEVLEYKIHYCTRRSDPGVNLHAPVGPRATGELSKDELKKLVPDIKFTL